LILSRPGNYLDREPAWGRRNGESAFDEQKKPYKRKELLKLVIKRFEITAVFKSAVDGLLHEPTGYRNLKIWVGAWA